MFGGMLLLSPFFKWLTEGTVFPRCGFPFIFFFFWRLDTKKFWFVCMNEVILVFTSCDASLEYDRANKVLILLLPWLPFIVRVQCANCTNGFKVDRWIWIWKTAIWNGAWIHISHTNLSQQFGFGNNLHRNWLKLRKNSHFFSWKIDLIFC